MIGVGLLTSVAPSSGQVTASTEPVIGLPCEGCEAVFVGLPDSLGPDARIAPEGEPGEPLVIRGTVYDAAGDPAPGVIVYAYHTDAGGIYPPDEGLRGTDAFPYGRLRAWAVTDAAGRYRFRTIRPGAYPGRAIPQHVHMHVIEVGCCTYYLNSIRFTDDPLLTDEHREETEGGRGGNALVTPRRDEHGVWVAERDIFLGRGVPGYDERPRGGSGQAP